MVWTEFWNGLFTKGLQLGLLAILVIATITIFMLLCASCAFGMDYLIDKHAQAKKKKQREK